MIHTKSHNPQSLNEVPATPFADVIKSEKKKKKQTKGLTRVTLRLATPHWAEWAKKMRNDTKARIGPVSRTTMEASDNDHS